MKLTFLQLQNFRSYKNLELKINSSPFVITGENGIGKTNILEAIHFLSTGKTFRSGDQDSLIQFGMDFFIVKGTILADAEKNSKKNCEEVNLEVAYSNYPRKQKVFKVNDVVTPHSKYLGNLITVLFHPKDLNLLYMEPSLRRKYINLLLSQTDKFYLENLTAYTKLLKQRNALLEEISEGNVSQDELDIWDEKLAHEGANIILKRIEAISKLNKILQKNYQRISGGKEKVEMKYSCTVTVEGSADKEKENSKESTKKSESESEKSESNSEQSDSKALHFIKSAYLKKLLLKRDKDIRYGMTSIGPHRDDIKFSLNGNPIEEFASRGESRTLLIALKISEISYIQTKTKTSPLLLLDDVFSELDENRQKFLLETLSSCQTVVTSVNIPENLEKKKEMQVMRL